MTTRTARPVKRAWRRLRDAARGGLARLGLADPLLPPRHIARIGSGDFRRTGEEFLRHFIDLGGLRPDEAVLDVGCGAGRMAVPLTRYLQPPGRYLGFDLMADAVAWCRRAITPQFPHFEFLATDVFNATYNPGGSIAPESFRFPCESGTFDFAILTSVFTHMLPAAVVHYLDELRRVLRPGGRVLLTAFLLNDESRELLSEGRGEKSFGYPLPDCRVENPARPEDAVAYDESWLLRRLRERGLNTGTIRYGSWAGRGEYLSRQDIVVAGR